MWAELAPWAGGGLIGLTLWAALALVRIAVNSERRRADDWHIASDDWRKAAATTGEANAVMNANVEKLVDAVGELAASQRETLALLRTMAAERRDAA